MIVSGAKDNKIKIWNTLGQLKHTVIDERFGEISALKIDNNTMTVIFGDSKGQVFKFCLSSQEVVNLSSQINCIDVIEDS